jgi:cell fate regulator YaaT (PSP1 superfamily)
MLTIAGREERSPVSESVMEAAPSSRAAGGSQASEDPVPSHEGRGEGVGLVHVLFKGRRVECYANPDLVPLSAGLAVVVEVERGEDIGEVLLLDGPDLRRRKDLEIHRILRPAAPEELRELLRIRAEEDPAALLKVRERVGVFGLPMHMLDAEVQFDRHRVTFYFTAGHRIDFRRLVRDLAATFHTRIELRQVGTREAARRLGGLGSCGRELCCRSILCDFERIPLRRAREQRMAVNPARLSGICGRLLCCLNFEESLPPGVEAFSPDQDRADAEDEPAGNAGPGAAA